MAFTKPLMAIALAFGVSSLLQAQVPPTQTPPAQTPQRSRAPTDSEIAHVFVTANSVDVDAGKLALTRSQNREVTKFANEMVIDHTKMSEETSDLAMRLGVAPADNFVSRQVLIGSKTNLDRLQGMTGAAFDKAYIDHEVVYHQAALAALDKTLIPNAKNVELKELMEKARPTFVSHLEQAKQIQTSLSK